MCRHDRLEVANSAGFVELQMKPAHVPGTSLGSLYGMQIRVPNITGYLSKSDFSHDTSYTGVFSQTERGNALGGGTSGYENTWDSPYFSARAANSTYGSSSVVQPASIRLMLCIKI